MSMAIGDAQILTLYQTFQKSLGTVSIGFLMRAVLPDWVLNLSSKGRDIRTAYEELGVSKAS